MFYSNHHKKNSNLENKSKGGFEQNLQIGKFYPQSPKYH